MKAYTHWFRQQKIYQKIFQTNVVSIVAAILPLVVALFVFEYFSMRAIVLKEIDIKTNIVRDSAAAALAFRDAVTASEALSTLKASPEIEFAYLVLTDNSVLASSSNGGNLMLQVILNSLKALVKHWKPTNIPLANRCICVLNL